MFIALCVFVFCFMCLCSLLLCVFLLLLQGGKLLAVMLLMGIPTCVATFGCSLCVLLLLGAPHRDVASRCSLLCCCFWELLVVGGIYVHTYSNSLVQIQYHT